jgi:hypothetical protein
MPPSGLVWLPLGLVRISSSRPFVGIARSTCLHVSNECRTPYIWARHSLVPTESCKAIMQSLIEIEPLPHVAYANPFIIALIRHDQHGTASRRIIASPRSGTAILSRFEYNIGECFAMNGLSSRLSTSHLWLDCWLIKEHLGPPSRYLRGRRLLYEWAPRTS